MQFLFNHFVNLPEVVGQGGGVGFQAGLLNQLRGKPPVAVVGTKLPTVLSPPPPSI